MSTKTERALGIGLGIMALGTVGFFAVACHDVDEEANDIGEERLPVVAERLAEELELDEAQRGHLGRVRDMAHEQREQHMAEGEEHFTELRTAAATGEVDSEEVHGRIDQKAEEITALAHRVADELIALVRSLDQDQRQVAVERLDRMHERMQAFHQRMASEEGGREGFFAHLRARRCGGGPFGAFLED